MQRSVVNDRGGSVLASAAWEIYGSPKVLGLLASLSALIAIAGPFGTEWSYVEAQRYLYWGLIVFVTVYPVTVVMRVVQRWRRVRPAAQIAFAAFVSALPVAGAVVVIGLIFGFGPSVEGTAWLYGQCALMILAILIAMSLAEHTPSSAADAGQPAILRRVPGAKRGRLLRLTAQDHYVEIVTDRGVTLAPMRLRDAIAEAAPVEGAQVHRSHWVAKAAVAGRRAVGGRMHLLLSDGAGVPVGRTFRAQAKKAGVIV
ncbi:MAG: LytTR family DNA-binding domain-containing protein [Pseudomonadota bacterium]